ncbi:MAG: TRAP transporter substrate-binding protein DctP [Candidatus Adiutrix sp.]|nr:TRAP transporter substrate-binding protein DctP [Candidatus Adiutrix sp.]
MNMVAKRLAFLLLASGLLWVLAGCGSEPSAPQSGADGGGSPLPAAAASAGEEALPAMTLTFASHLPETGVDGASLKYFFEEVSRETGGRLTFEYYFAGSLVSATDSLASVAKGLVDIAFVPEGFFETQFYPTFVATIPYTSTSEWVTNKALGEMFRTYAPFKKMCEAQNVVNLGVVAPSELAMCSNKKIENLEDLSGIKIRAMGSVNKDMSKLGATPVALAAGEIYEALERKTVDAATGIPITLAVSFKLQETSKYFMMTGYGMYTTSGIYINKDVYAKLPEKYKAAFEIVYDRFVDEYSGEEWMGGALKASVQAIKEAGGEIVVLSPEERARWAEKLAGDTEEFVRTATSYGYDGQEILNTYRTLVEKYAPNDRAYQLYQ